MTRPARSRTVWIGGDAYNETQARALAGASGVDWAASWRKSSLGWTGYESSADCQREALPAGGRYTVAVYPTQGEAYAAARYLESCK